jgi:hypothetical protein
MMKRQISKKKLERLTIHGGDYRKAGQREGGRSGISIDDLKGLLEDDVKNLSRMETTATSTAADAPQQAGVGGISDSTGSSSSSSSSSSSYLQRDISDAELDVVMNRELLFGHLAPLTNPHNLFGELNGPHFDDSEKRAIAQVLVSEEKEEKAANVGVDDEEGEEEEAAAQYLAPNELAIRSDDVLVPVEGEMYDIVVNSSGASLLSAIG